LPRPFGRIEAAAGKHESSPSGVILEGSRLIATSPAPNAFARRTSALESAGVVRNPARTFRFLNHIMEAKLWEQGRTNETALPEIW